jgi:two-component system chemotaxis sensor kinase CheA
MPTQDEEFIQRLRATFKVEAEEHLQSISSMLLELEKASAAEAAGTIESVYREAHTLKGAARAVDLGDIEAICQALESVFSAWKRQQASPSAEAFDMLHRALDAIRQVVNGSEAAKGPGPIGQRDELVKLLNRLQSQAPAPDRKQTAQLRISPQQQSAALAVAASPSPVQPAQPVEPEKTAATETVRISIAKLDARLREAEDMLVVKAAAAARAVELRETAGLFEHWRKEWAKISSEVRVLGQANGRSGQPGGADRRDPAVPEMLLNFLDWNSDYLRVLESRLAALAAKAEQDRHSVARRVDDLLEDSKKLLMLPFSTVADVFPRLIRDVCRDQGKEAELVLRGGEVEIDKRILEEMKDALIHILRNCIDHGIEKPADRSSRNKPPRATITIAVSPVNGSKVEILVCDDGGGVDVQGIKHSAVRHGILSEADASALPDQQALSLVFHSDVSTSPVVTSISGRGLGMAIVREKTDKLGGQVSIESNRGAGTTLKMVLPLTLSTFRGVLVAVGDRAFVVPSANVERVLRIKPQEIQTVENREVITLQGRAVSLARLGAVLEIPAKPKPGKPGAPIPVAVIHFADQRIAFAVDEVLHEEEVLVKSLRKPLVRVRNIAGATVLGSGRVVPVLNASDLMKSARHLGAAPLRATESATEAPRARRKVLVVEDSVTSRMLLKGILESAGYQVQTAVDGVEAYATLRQDVFDLVVSDVEMPRMNGFDLTAKVRGDKKLADLPVILVTALESREEKERGIDAGANAYIVKSSFDQSNLLDVIKKLV